MASSRIERLPTEVLLQICELLRDNYTERIYYCTLAQRHIPTASIYSFSETCKRIRQVATIVIFRNVILPIRSLERVEEDVQNLCDTLGSVSALDHIHTLRLCDAWNSPENNQKIERGFFPRLGSNMASAEDAWTHDHAWIPVVDLLRRCSALTDLRYESSHQLSPCVLNALHQYRPRCRLHMRTFCARTLLQSEKDKHELAIASSPCLHSIWFKYMEAGEDIYAHYSQKVVQQVLAALAPNVENVRFLRSQLVGRRLRRPMVPPGTELVLLEKDKISRSARLKRLVISAYHYGGVELTKHELEGWHKHVDFSCLRTLVLDAPLELRALRWLKKCNLASLEELSFQLHDDDDRASERAMEYAKEFVVGLPPLSKLSIRDLFKMLPSCIKAILLRHGASLRSLRLQHMNGIRIRSARRILESMQGLCSQLTDLTICILREQGNIDEMRLYRLFAGLPTLRCLTLSLVGGGGLASRFTVGGQLMILPTRLARHKYDEFDQQILEDVTRDHNPLYGDVRRAFIDKAIDENFVRTVYRLACATDRLRSLREFVLTSDPYFFIDAARKNTPIREVFSHICRSWTVQPGIRNDRPDELVVREMDRPRDIQVDPAPEKLDPRVEQIFRRIWPGSEDGSSDWRTDWHSFLVCDEEAEPKDPPTSQS